MIERMAKDLTCPMCGWVGSPAFELVDDKTAPLGGKLAAKCGRAGCAYIDARLTPQDFNEGIAVDKDGSNARVIETRRGHEEKLVEVVIDRRRAPSKDTRLTKPIARPDEPIDVIALMRQRRDYLEMEVARLEASKVELRKLNKMIAVADREQARIDVEAHARATVDSEIAAMSLGGDAE